MEKSTETNGLENANEIYAHHTATENHYKTLLGLVYTDGVRQVLIDCECYWLLVEIASAQLIEKVELEEFQVWKLARVKDHRFILSCEDGNDQVIYSKDITYSDFPYKNLTFWVENKVIYLPSEH